MRNARLIGALVLVLGAGLGAAACREEGEITIAQLTFTGVEQVDKSALTGALATKQGSRFPWGRKTSFDRRAFEADLQRIQAFYLDRGFPDARVRSFDVELNERQDEVRVTVDIVEGEPIRVAAFEMNGFEVLPPRQRRALENSLPLQAEQPLDRQAALATRDRALEVLREAGYPYAAVSMRSEDAGPRAVRLSLDAAPGPLAHIGVVDIRGEASVDEHVIRRQLTFKTGDRFTVQELRDSQRKLYGLELFEFANIESIEEPELQQEDVPVRVTVAEGKHRKISAGLGYGSEEHARARLRWDHVNFFGGARQAGFEGRWSSLNRGVRVDYTEPYLFSPSLSLRFEGLAWEAVEPVYSQQRLGGRAIVRHQINPQTNWSVSFINEFEHSSITDEGLTDLSVRNNLISLGLDPRDGETRGTLGAIAIDGTRMTTNNVLDPRRGYLLTGRVEQAGGIMWGTYRYWSAAAEARHYLPLGNRTVLANRVSLSSVDPAGGDDGNVPFHRRLFLGGATSVRGWGRYELSPLSGFGFPIGGLSMMEGSSEMRFPVAGNLGAVAFLDFGNVWTDEWAIALDDLRYAAGMGLRYATPVGPVRIDLGYQLNPTNDLLVNGKPQDRRWRVHFSIGQAF